MKTTPENIFRPIKKAWFDKLKIAKDHKKSEFGDDAAEATKFFDGPYDWMYGPMAQTKGSFALGSEDAPPRTTFRMTLNKVAELVQLYGPALYHRNPHREAEVRQHEPYPFEMMQPPPEAQQTLEGMMAMQQMQQQAQEMGAEEEKRRAAAGLLKECLNFTPNELGLAEHSREAIDEALITGMGVLWHETLQPPGAKYKFAGSFYDSVDNLLIDPDMKSIRHAKWIARRCVAPKREVEEEYGLKPGTLKGDMESFARQAETSDPSYEYFRARGDTNDLTVYFKIWSRMGVGHRLHKEFDPGLKANAETFDRFGDFTYQVLCDDYPYFLNAPEEAVNKEGMDDMFMRFQWPTPFWADPTDPWPFSPLCFHKRPGKVWPMSHVKPGLGQLKFMNWVLSFLADKVKNTSRDFIATLKSADQELKNAIMSGGDLTLLEFDGPNKRIGEVIQFLQHQPMNRDILEVVQLMEQYFDKSAGLDELMYGQSSRQMRSSAEAQIKEQAKQIRPSTLR